MAESIQSGLVQATQVAREAAVRRAANGVRFAAFGEIGLDDGELVRMVQAVPTAVAAALGRKTYYFVPLALAEGRGSESAGHRSGNEETMISPVYTAELAEQAICHRNLALGAGGDAGEEGVFISTRLLRDRFSLAFELFINVGHAFVDEAGVPESFSELAWNQAVADVRGETSQDAWESRAQAVGGGQNAGRDGRSMRRPGRSISRRRSPTRLRSICCRWRWTSTTRSCASGSTRCWPRRRWRSGCGWWRGCFRRMRSTSLRSGIGGGREARVGIDKI